MVKNIKYIILVLGVMSIVLLNGCNGIKKTPTEEQIIKDLTAQYPSGDMNNCHSLEIVRSQLLAEEKRWIADVVLEITDDYADMSQKMSLEYDFYDDNGWMLDTENTIFEEYTVDEVHRTMEDEEINNFLQHFDATMEYIDDEFDVESGTHYIDYTKVKRETFFFKGIVKGTLECTYMGTDIGWGVAYDNASSVEYSLKAENILGGYIAEGELVVGTQFTDIGILIKEYTDYGKNLVLNIYTAEGQFTEFEDVIMYDDVDYHAELVKIDYYELGSDRERITAEYKITDTEVGEWGFSISTAIEKTAETNTITLDTNKVRSPYMFERIEE